MTGDRDFIGYGAEPPDPQWPGGARIAVNINVNFEGGGERSMLEGDEVSEGALNDIGAPSLPGLRAPLVESVFEYGSRVGATLGTATSDGSPVRTALFATAPLPQAIEFPDLLNDLLAGHVERDAAPDQLELPGRE